MSWYLEVLKKYTVFNGRAGRPEFWYFVLFNFVIGVVLSIVDRAVGTTAGSSGSGLFYGLYALAVLLPNIGVGIRRMHDINRSGWWVLFPIVNIVFWAQQSQAGANQYGQSAPSAPGAA